MPRPKCRGTDILGIQQVTSKHIPYGKLEIIFYHVKGTVNVISSDPPMKDGNADSERNSDKLCLISKCII